MHLTGPAKRQACAAIDDHSARCVDSASFTCDGVRINFYCVGGRILRCESDDDYNERRIDQVEGRDLAEFMQYHHMI